MKARLFILITVLFISGCWKKFNYELDFSKQIVVNSVLIPDSAIFVVLTYAGSIDSLSNYVEPVYNAYVEISDDNGNKAILREIDSIPNYFNAVFFSTTHLYYTEALRPKEGSKYYLKVVVAGYDTIYSQTIVPYSPKVDSITYFVSEELIDEFFGQTQKVVYYTLYLDDTSESSNFYFLINKDNMSKLLFSNDGAKEIERKWILFSDRSFNNNEYGLKFYYYAKNENDQIYFYQVNEDFFKYFYSAARQIPPELPNPFLEPVYVYDNIENGLGVFCAISKPVIIKIPEYE